VSSLVSGPPAEPSNSSNSTSNQAESKNGALVNGVFLVALCFSITMESMKRFYEPEEIHDPELILCVGALGLLVNLLGLGLFAGHGHSHGGHGHSHGGHGHSHESHGHSHGAHSHSDLENSSPSTQNTLLSPNGDSTDGKEKAEKLKMQEKSSQLNMKGVYLHVLADALGSVIVIISAVIMWLTEWEYKLYVDPALSLCMVCLMLRSVWPLLIESAMILLQTVPSHIDIEELRSKLLKQVKGVLAVHEFHIWQLAGDRIIASAHIKCLNLSEYMKVARNVKEFFHNNGIHSTTIQAEFVEIDGVPSSPHGFKKCVLDCPTDDSTGEKQDSCLASVCCPEPKNRNKKKRHHSWSHDDPNDKLRRNSFKFDGNQILHQNGHFKLGHGDKANSQLINRTCDKYASSLPPDQPIGNPTCAKSEMPYQAEFTPNPNRPTEHDIEMGGAAHDENEETRPIFTPTAKSRVVRIVQKHTNV